MGPDFSARREGFVFAVELLRWSGFGSGQAERCAGKVKILAKVESFSQRISETHGGVILRCMACNPSFNLYQSSIESMQVVDSCGSQSSSTSGRPCDILRL